MLVFLTHFQVFTLLLARMMAMLSVTPAYGAQTLAFFHRMSLSFLISVIVTPVIDITPEFKQLIETRYLTLILEQLFMGFLIGFAMQMLFGAFQMAGEFFSVQMGFGVSEVFDPMSQSSLPLMGTVKNLMALLVFFISGSHMWLLQGVVYSYEKIPYLSLEFLQASKIHEGILEFLVLLSSGMFIIALKIALPVMGTLFLTSLVLGILSKAAPQMNILMLGFPLKILIGFIILVLVSPVFIQIISAQFDVFFNHLDGVIDSWSKAARNLN